MLRIKKLEWDSAFFGINVGKGEIEDVSMVDDIGSNEFDLLYIFVEKRDKQLNQILVHNGALLVDEKVTFFKKIEQNNQESENIFSYHRSYTFQDEEVIRIGTQSGQYSRFYIDPNFKREDYYKLYTIWLERSLDREIAKEFLIYKNNDLIEGVITIGEKNGRADIGILAVDEHTRGKNIGKKLIQSTEAYCCNKGYDELQVVTQLANSVACKFYESCGFKIESIVSVYHLWKKK